MGALAEPGDQARPEAGRGDQKVRGDEGDGDKRQVRHRILAGLIRVSHASIAK